MDVPLLLSFKNDAVKVPDETICEYKAQLKCFTHNENDINGFQLTFCFLVSLSVLFVLDDGNVRM